MHTVKDKAKLLTRVRRIQGQIAALEKQLGQDEDCAAVLQQIAAIRGAVNGLMASVLEGHLTDHIVNEADQQQRQEELGVIMQVVKSYLK